jgi:hypothetical protein
MPCDLTAQTGLVIYDDALENSWANWSWSSTIDLGNTSVVNSGSKSIAATITGAWGALYLQHSAFNSSSYSNLIFWINGGPTGGQQLQVSGHAGGAEQLSTNLPTLSANSWRQFSVPLASLGIANRTDVDGLWLWDRVGAPQATFYVDGMMLSTNSIPAPTVTLASPADGATYTAAATIILSAAVVTNNHSIVKVQFYNATTLLNEDTVPPYSYTWSGVTVGTYALFARVIYDSGGSVDSATASVTVTGTTSLPVSVDAQLNRHAISPLIYGVAFATSAQLSELNSPINRSGGNAETRYNWLIDAHNRGADWYFETIADGSGIPGADADNFISTSKTGGADPMLTVPMIGWTCKLGPSRAHLASFSAAKYGPQQKVDPYWSDAGNGVSKAGGTNIVNDPKDANFATNANFQAGWLQHLTNTWGSSLKGGLKYYLMDNEHSIWFSSHRDVHPIGPTMREIRDDILAYAGLVKSNDPSALVCAPEEWGWSGYFYSGYDQQNSGFHDRANNGGLDYMPWLLNQLHQHDTGTGQRLLDYFTLHCYPQAGEFGSDVSTSMQQLRNQSTRQFWDTNYVDQSWIGQQSPPNNILMLIPRMKKWVAANYPGTKIGVTEYNWGAEGHINGATAQADILGIFGREGLDLATRWTTPDASTPTYKAMKLFRNYDGNKSTFGDTSVSASTPNPDSVSTFAAVRSSDGALTLMVVNKQLISAAAVNVSIANYSAAQSAEAWQLTSANAINRLTDVTLSGNTLNTTVPAQSITLFVLKPSAATPPPPVLVPSPSSLSSSNAFTFSLLNGVAGQRYVILSSIDLSAWSPVQTNTLTTVSNSYALPISGVLRFYRAQWAP